jgi:intein/homing endonuclease
MEDLIEGVDNFFIITNVETLRNKDIANQLQRMCRSGEIGMVIADEIHKCLEGSSVISTDKGQLTIKEIVENKINCNVYSYNISTQQIELQPIEYFHKYVNNEDLLEIEMENGQILKLTPDHKVFTKNRGYIQASELTLQDELISLQNSYSYVNISTKEDTNARKTM